MRDPYAEGRRTREDKRDAARPQVLAIITRIGPTTVADADDGTCLSAEFHLNGAALRQVVRQIEHEFEIDLDQDGLLDMAMLGPRFGRLLDLVVDQIDE